MDKSSFPILSQTNRGKPLVYLDSAATTQKPQVVIDAITDFYTKENANINRGVYELSETSSRDYQLAREKVARFINADPKEVVFTAGTTASINAIAYASGQSEIKAGDEILLTEMEHHSNIVPWQVVAKQVGATIKVVKVKQDGELDLDDLKAKLTEKTKVLAIVHASNTLGTINPIKEICALAHQQNVIVVVDAAQSVPHMPVDVKALDCDFLVFSGHKLYGPTGIGILYGKQQWLEKLTPYQTGGGMIDQVAFEETQYAQVPEKWEAGTPNIAGAIALGAAVDYLNAIGMEQIWQHEHELTEYALQQLATIPGLKIMGGSHHRVGVIAFSVDNVHSYDLGALLDAEGIAVRTGHHCTMPLHKKVGVSASVRASFGVYNNKADVDALVTALHKAITILT